MSLLILVFRCDESLMALNITIVWGIRLISVGISEAMTAFNLVFLEDIILISSFLIVFFFFPWSSGILLQFPFFFCFLLHFQLSIHAPSETGDVNTIARSSLRLIFAAAASQITSWRRMASTVNVSAHVSNVCNKPNSKRKTKRNKMELESLSEDKEPVNQNSGRLERCDWRFNWNIKQKRSLPLLPIIMISQDVWTGTWSTITQEIQRQVGMSSSYFIVFLSCIFFSKIILIF